MADRLLRKSEVLDRLGVSRPTMDRLIARGDLPVVRVSERAVRIPEGALRQYIADRTERRGH